MKKIISILTVGLLLGGSLGICQGQPNSPAGITWDCLLNGKEQEGIAFILFL
jgi:hypothetical protein